MKTVPDVTRFGLDSLELKALSVPASLRFLLGIEYDVVLCVNEVGTRRPFRLHFPVFATTFRKLLSLCATRFGLECEHGESDSVLFGTAAMPLLRYADYLPGALHVKEILECLKVEPAARAKKWHSPTSLASSPVTPAKEPVLSEVAAANSGTSEFAAGFIDYSEFSSDSSLEDVHGLGFYLMLDYGLSLATHSHLVGIRFHKDWDAQEALREFQDFSGWDEFDLRFQDENRRQEGGVIVMPTSQDACDLLERYEDEDSDDEGDMLPFILRPVSPLVSVPSLEDSALRKLRDQHWAEVEQHWSHLPRTLNTVVVYNLYDGATLAEVLAFFEGLPIVSSEFVEDNAPTHRRRAFLTFADLGSTRKALDVDGKNTRGCTLRVQVSPPYISATRRGHEVKPERVAAPVHGSSPCPTAGSSPKLTGNHGGKAAAASSPHSSPATRTTDNGAASAVKNGSAAVAAEGADTSKSPKQSGRGATLASAPAARTAFPAAVPAAVPAAARQPIPAATSPGVFRAVNASAAIAGAVSARAHAASSTEVFSAGASSASAPVAITNHGVAAVAREHETGLHVGSATSSHGASHMNAAAKEFVPQFHLSATSPEYRPSPAPGLDGAAPDGILPPPPPPPPSYGTALHTPAEFRPTPRTAQLVHAGVSPNLPTYFLPPPYIPGEEEVEDARPPPPPPPPLPPPY